MTERDDGDNVADTWCPKIPSALWSCSKLRGASELVSGIMPVSGSLRLEGGRGRAGALVRSAT